MYNLPVNLQVISNLLNTPIFLEWDRSSSLVSREIQKIKQESEHSTIDFFSTVKTCLHYHQIQRQLDLLKAPPSFAIEKIKKEWLDLLQLQEAKLISAFLPIHYSEAVNQAKISIEKDLTTSNTIWIQKEIFHFFADVDSQLDLRLIHLEKNTAAHSAFSFCSILEKYLHSYPDDTSIQKLHQSFLFFEKLACYMLMIRQLNAKGSFLKEEDFYKYLLSKTHRQHFSIHDISESKITINYAHRFSPIPKKYLMSHLTDLILKAIQDLDHLLFLPLGTAHHAIICVIEKKDETYTYRIFNTGKGFKKGGHLYRFENKKLFIKPITIENLNIKAFSYTFIFDLVQAIIDNQLTLEDWYQLHHSALIDKAGGQWITEQGPEYLGQKADTCTYRSIEASAFFYLSSTVQQKLNQAKLEVSQNKYHTYIFNQNEPTITNQELLKVLIDKQKKN